MKGQSFRPARESRSDDFLRISVSFVLDPVSVTATRYKWVMAGGDRLPIIIPLLEDKELASIDELDDHILLLEAARRRLDVEWTESIGVFEDRKGHEVFSYPNMVAYLKHRARIAASRASRYVFAARSALRFRATFASWRVGQITTDQAQMLFQAARQLPDKYPAAEAVLLEIIGDTAEETEKTLAYWRHSVDRRGLAVDLEAQMARRRFDYSLRASGMIEGEFALTNTAGEAFIAALDSVMPPPEAGDDRSGSQRRHDAFEDLARGFLAGGEPSHVGGERPHVNVFVDVDALEGIPGGLHETEGGRVLDIETIRLLSCDSSVSRIVWKGESEIMNVGRRTRVIPTALRRAVVARDRHCMWKGCSRSPRWCDVHHLHSWADGGDTSLSNLCLLCRYHHTLVHRHDGDLDEVLDLRIVEPEMAGRPT